MKKTLFLIVALLMSANTFADTWAGVYAVNTNTISNTAGDYDSSDVNIAFGQAMNSNIGLGYEAFFNNAGLGGSVEMFTTINNKYKISLGAISVPENARMSLDATYPEASSNDNGEGVYIGFSTKLSGNKYLGVKYIRYDANHDFTSSRCVSACGTKKQVINTVTASGSAEREQIWVGITFHL